MTYSAPVNDMMLAMMAAGDLDGLIAKGIYPGLDVDTVKRTMIQLRDGGYIRLAEEKVSMDDLDALRRLFTLLGMKEQVRA